MSKILSKSEAELFIKQFSNLNKKEMEKLEYKLVSLYEDSVELVERLVKSGFTEEYKDIVAKEWVLFLTKVIVKIEQMKAMSGSEKHRLVIALSILIIIKHLPIDYELKELLIMVIKEFLPIIIDSIVLTTKKMHTLSAWLVKKLRSCCM